MMRALLFALLACATSLAGANEGIRYTCAPSRIGIVTADMTDYLRALGIAPELVTTRIDLTQGIALYTLNTPPDDTDTLTLKDRPEMAIHDETVELPNGDGKYRRIAVVSKKEILLSLMQHGRLTEFQDQACDVEALKEHVGLRQNIAAWAGELHWVWPDGDAAQWNKKYWTRGTPNRRHPLHEALADVFVHQPQYSIGCYTAAKLVIVQGVLDYFRRVKKSPARLKQLERRLWADGEPLSGIEPGRMWDFEPNFDPRDADRPGKLMKLVSPVAPKNFVAGDWIYLLNTDAMSYRKTGYEGANPIYLGRNRFADYFDDHDHAYSYEEKLDEVYQWRNGVFSRSRDAAKRKPLTQEDYERLSHAPVDGGLQTGLRTFPYLFGFEALPPIQ